MNSDIKVSVIIPVYNVEKYLKECINSVRNQTLAEIEIICVDDGSTDSSYEILKELQSQDNRIVVLKQQNEFAGVARNKGIEIANGEYLIFLDSDDFFEKDLLETLYNTCKKHDADVCVCDADNYDNSTGKYFDTGYYWKEALSAECISREVLGVNTFLFTYPMPWNKMYRKALVDKYNLRFQKIRKTNDLGFVYLGIACADKIAVADKKLIHYRVGLSDSLQAKNKGMDVHFSDALVYLKNGLKERGMFDKVKSSYNNLVMRTYIYEYKRQLKNEHMKMYRWFFDEGITKLEFDDKGLLPSNRLILGGFQNKKISDINGNLFRIHFVFWKLVLKVLKKDKPYKAV